MISSFDITEHLAGPCIGAFLGLFGGMIVSAIVTGPRTKRFKDYIKNNRKTVPGIVVTRDHREYTSSGSGSGGDMKLEEEEYRQLMDYEILVPFIGNKNNNRFLLITVKRVLIDDYLLIHKYKQKGYRQDPNIAENAIYRELVNLRKNDIVNIQVCENYLFPKYIKSNSRFLDKLWDSIETPVNEHLGRQNKQDCACFGGDTCVYCESFCCCLHCLLQTQSCQSHKLMKDKYYLIRSNYFVNLEALHSRIIQNGVQKGCINEICAFGGVVAYIIGGIIGIGSFLVFMRNILDAYPNIVRWYEILIFFLLVSCWMGYYAYLNALDWSVNYARDNKLWPGTEKKWRAGSDLVIQQATQKDIKRFKVYAKWDGLNPMNNENDNQREGSLQFNEGRTFDGNGNELELVANREHGRQRNIVTMQ